MIDRPARQQLVAALVAYMRGDIRTREFARRLDAVRSRDEPIVRDIAFELEFLYHDFYDYPISVTEGTWDDLRRLIAALESELAVADREVPPVVGGPPWAPFWSEEQFRRYEPLLARHDLPPFDPTIHSGPQTPYTDISFLFRPLQWLFRPLARLLKPVSEWRPRRMWMVEEPNGPVVGRAD